MEQSNYSPRFYYNGSEVSLYKTEEFIIENINVRDFESLVLDNGVFAEMSYQVRITNYAFEYPDTKYQNVYTAREAYDEAMREFKNFKSTIESVKFTDEMSDSEIQARIDDYSKQEDQLVETIHIYYDNLIQELDETITQYKEANAIL